MGVSGTRCASRPYTPEEKKTNHHTNGRILYLQDMDIHYAQLVLALPQLKRYFRLRYLLQEVL